MPHWKLGSGAVGDDGEEVAAGECISYLAARKGLVWKDVWEHSDNKNLKDTRKHPNILLPGDRITIPKKKKKEEPKKDKKRHRMKLKGVPCIMRLRFTLFGKPREKEKYQLFVDGKRKPDGKLNDDGALEAKISPRAKEAIVFLGLDQDSPHEEFSFKLGWVAPVDEPKGVQARLWNLNYYHGDLSDSFDENSEGAFFRFSQKNENKGHGIYELEVMNLEALSRKDQEDMVPALVERHGC